MARPTKQTVDYFPHICVSGKTLYILENSFGNDGYAFWFKLLELLSTSEGHFYDCNNPADWEFLLAKTHQTEDNVNIMLRMLVNCDAIDRELWEWKVIWVQKLVDNIADVYKRRNTETPLKPSLRIQEGVYAGVNVNRNPPETLSDGVNVNINTQSKLKYSKVYNIYSSIFEFWNSSNIIRHNNLNNGLESTIKIALKDHNEEEIKQAIKNYAEILFDEQYYFKYKWTLKDFLKRGLEKFLDLETARGNYRRDSISSKQEKKGGKDAPSPYTSVN